jgi:DNA (cytosine-5)-methyltransferase 1
MRFLDLFSGIGGFSLGLERAGHATVAFCEIDPWCRRVLRKHWPDTPIYDDIRKLDLQDLIDDEIECDAICGGFPCQEMSRAGARTGLAGERSGLWREMVRTVRMVGPKLVIVENVAELLDRGMGEVLGDLAALGYDTEWHCISARDIGAPQLRDRIWIVAYAVGARRQRLVTGENPGASRHWGVRGAEDLQRIAAAPFERSSRWPQPLLRRVDDGISGNVDRLRGLGNAIVPQIAEMIGRAVGIDAGGSTW